MERQSMFMDVCVYLVTQLCPTLCDPMDGSLPTPLSLIFFRQEAELGCHFLLQGIFPAHRLNLCLLCHLHCRQILYPLGNLGSMFIDKKANIVKMSVLSNLIYRFNEISIKKIPEGYVVHNRK